MLSSIQLCKLIGQREILVTFQYRAVDGCRESSDNIWRADDVQLPERAAQAPW